MLTIPTQPVPNQTLQAQVGGQTVTIFLQYKQAQGLFADVAANGITMISGALALDVVPIVANEYLGFIGNLFFVDTQGNENPVYTGLGSRFQLVYLTADEYALISQ